MAIVAMLLAYADAESVFARIAACPWPLAAAALVATLAAQWLAGVRLADIAATQRVPMSPHEGFTIGLSVAFFGAFVPGGAATGWAVRLARMVPSMPALPVALALVTTDRLLATGTGILTGIVAGLILNHPGTGWITAALAVSAGMVAAAGLLLLRRPASPMLGGTFERWLTRRLDAYGTNGGGRLSPEPLLARVGKLVTLSLGVHAFGIAAWMLLAHALGVDLGIWALVWIRSAALLAALLPTVGGLGPRESAVVFLGGMLGLPAADGLALALLVFAATVVPTAMLGGLAELARLADRGTRYP